MYSSSETSERGRVHSAFCELSCTCSEPEPSEAPPSEAPPPDSPEATAIRIGHAMKSEYVRTTRRSVSSAV